MKEQRTFLILGSPQSKANSRRIIFRGNRPRSIKSLSALQYEESCVSQLKEQNEAREPLQGPVGVNITVWYSSRRPDLDVSLILDCMQKAQVYVNDRQIIEQHLFKQLDKDNPRSEIEVYEL